MIARLLNRIFRKPSITVATYKVKKTDYEKKRRECTAQLARELGRPNPLEGR